MTVVWLAHPYGGHPWNLDNARAWLHWALVNFPGVCPIAPWITTCEVLDETHRARGMDVNLTTISRCDEVWLCGNEATPGMLREAVEAMGMGLIVIDFTHTPFRSPPGPGETLPGRVWMPSDYAAAKLRLEQAAAKAVQTPPTPLVGAP